MGNRHDRRWTRLATACVVGAMVLTACGGEEDEPSATDTVGSTESTPAEEMTTEAAPSSSEAIETTGAEGAEPGDAEQTSLTVALPYPDYTQFSMYWVADQQGYYEEEGLEVAVITADDVLAAIASGSADVGVDSAGTVIDAVNKGVDVEILSGHFCRQNFDFATQPDLSAPEDLNGTDVVLAGTSGDPAEFERALVLEEEGWPIEELDVNLVYPGPDSAAWREFLIAGRVSLVPFYDDDAAALEEYGANMIVQTIRNWPNDLQLVRADWAQENPNTAVRFLRATMRANDYMVAPGVGEVPENKTAVLDLYESKDYEVEDLRASDSPWALGGHFFCPNLYFDEAAWDGTIQRQQLEPGSFSDNVDLTALERAQELLGRDNSPPKDVSYPS